MTKQIERIYNIQTGEVTERELTQAEIAQLATADPYAEQSTPKVADK